MAAAAPGSAGSEVTAEVVQSKNLWTVVVAERNERSESRVILQAPSTLHESSWEVAAMMMPYPTSSPSPAPSPSVSKRASHSSSSTGSSPHNSANLSSQHDSSSSSTTADGVSSTPGDSLDYSMFVLGLPEPDPDDATDEDIATLRAHVYRYDPNNNERKWEMVGNGRKMVACMPTRIRVLEPHTGELIYSIVPHDSLEFTELEHLFACVMIGEGEILGFRFTKEEDEIMFLDTLVELFNMALQLASRRLRNQRKKRSPCPLFCFNFMTGNRSVCFVTARLQFPIVQRLASAVVPALLSNIAVGTQFIEALVSELNALDLSGPNPTSFRFSRIKDSIELPPPPQASLGLYGPPLFRPLITAFGEGVVASIYNAVLAEMRVVLVGSVAAKVSSLVVAISCLRAPLTLDGPGPDHRHTFPCISLDTMSAFSPFARSYVVGTVDRSIKDKHDLWDVLCDLDDGTIRHSSAADRVLKQSAPLDLAFGAMLKYFASAGYPEAQLTKALRGYTTRLIEVATGTAQFQDAQSKSRELAANNLRITRWLRTSSYAAWKKKTDPADRDSEVLIGIRKLAAQKDIREKELIAILEAFVTHISTPEKKLQFRSWLVEVAGSVDVVATPLLHSSVEVRKCAVRALFRTGMLEPSSGLGRFFRMTYARLNTES